VSASTPKISEFPIKEKKKEKTRKEKRKPPNRWGRTGFQRVHMDVFQENASVLAEGDEAEPKGKKKDGNQPRRLPMVGDAS
jgi:hypothetical protein